MHDAYGSLLPTGQDIAFYRRHGWFLQSAPILTEVEIDALADAADRFWAGHRDRPLPLRPPRLTYWEPGDGDVFRNNDYICYEDLTFARILAKPIIGAIAGMLAGTDKIRLLNSTLWYKPSADGGATGVVPWHNDRDYWLTHSSDRLLTAYIPFHDCDERMGTLTVIDGSHRWEAGSPDDDRHFAEREPVGQRAALDRLAAANGAEVREVPLVYRKGQVSFHHCRTWHGSGPNLSPRPRRSVGLHLQDADNRWREYRTPDGERLSYNHDWLVRRTADDTPDYADPRFCPLLWDGR